MVHTSFKPVANFCKLINVMKPYLRHNPNELTVAPKMQHALGGSIVMAKILVVTRPRVPLDVSLKL